MNLTQKLDYLQTNHMSDWLKAREKSWDELSKIYSMMCICGRLCTGLHENNCKKFQNKITSDAVKRLGHLLPKKGDKKVEDTNPSN